MSRKSVATCVARQGGGAPAHLCNYAFLGRTDEEVDILRGCLHNELANMRDTALIPGHLDLEVRLHPPAAEYPKSRNPERNCIAPPLPILAIRHFLGGGGGVYFEAPRGRNFITPPFVHHPTLELYFQGWGVVVYKIWPHKNKGEKLAKSILLQLAFFPIVSNFLDFWVFLFCT